MSMESLLSLLHIPSQSKLAIPSMMINIIVRIVSSQAITTTTTTLIYFTLNTHIMFQTNAYLKYDSIYRI